MLFAAAIAVSVSPALTEYPVNGPKIVNSGLSAKATPAGRGAAFVMTGGAVGLVRGITGGGVVGEGLVIAGAGVASLWGMIGTTGCDATGEAVGLL